MPATAAYQNCLDEMFNLRRFGIKLGLDTIRYILEGLGNPQEEFNTIHVAGTNGKGSVAATLSSILRYSGYKVGLYTSPHLVRFNERIVVNDKPIEDDDVLAGYRAIKQFNHGGREPTFFECTTAMALHEFRRQKVQWAIIETGMGGRLDATNIISPKLSIITNVSLEHSEYLGNTIKQIATEKAGIIKHGIPVVTGVKQPSAINAVQTTAATNQSPLFIIEKDFRVRRTSQNTFTFQGPFTKWTGLNTSLVGRHQLENASLALAGCDVLLSELGQINERSIKKGLRLTRWPGRLEKVIDEPLTILDGAHNLIAARTLANYLQSHMADRRITLVIGILDDKPYQAMLEALVPICRRVIITQPKIQRALPTEILEKVAREFSKQVDVIPDVGRAAKVAIESSAPDDVVCIAGSLYVVGEAKAIIDDQIQSQSA
jgi:dihydrofolate synthase/folylpolyglutamate synthase